MSKNTFTCMICEKSNDMSFVSKLRDDDTRTAVRCELCGHIQIAPLPTLEEEEKFYKSNEMIRIFVSKDELTDDQVRLKYEQWSIKEVKKIKKLLKLSKDTKILEIGSGYGSFLEHMTKEGYCIDGIEINEEKCKDLYKRTGIQMQPLNILTENDKLTRYESKYDIVCMHQVLEHIFEPNLFLRRACSFLKDNGLIYVNVPNDLFYLKNICESFNKHYYCRAHVSYFSPQVLSDTLLKNGFCDVQIHGNQVYSLENALNWIRNGVPVKTSLQISLPEGLEFAEDYYETYLEERMVSDHMIAIGRKSPTI